VAAKAVRDFALSAGPFRLARAVAQLPRRVVVSAAVGVPLLSPKPFLAAAVRVLKTLSARYGVYPWSTFTVAVIPDQTEIFGQEYPTIVFISAPSAFLIPHETAHQWF